jgi:hypothetical protein
VTIDDSHPVDLSVPTERQKGPQIGLGNPHRCTKTMGDEFPAIDPTPNRARAHAEHFRHFIDGEELDGLARPPATIGS